MPDDARRALLSAAPGILTRLQQACEPYQGGAH